MSEARLGELLKDYPSHIGSKIGKRGTEKSLPEGITHKQSHYAQKLAKAREKTYGSLKEQAEKLDLDYGNIRKCASICKRYELLHRSNSLGFKHHQIAAAEEDRLEWLAKAEIAKSQKDKTLEEAQDVGSAVLWAEVRMGELLEEIPMKRDKESSNKRTSLLSLPPGITRKQSFYAQKLISIATVAVTNEVRHERTDL
jgi:hypothetical protein